MTIEMLKSIPPPNQDEPNYRQMLYHFNESSRLWRHLEKTYHFNSENFAMYADHVAHVAHVIDYYQHRRNHHRICYNMIKGYTP